MWMGIMGKREPVSSWLPSTALGQKEDAGMGGGASIQGGGTFVPVHTGLSSGKQRDKSPDCLQLK